MRLRSRTIWDPTSRSNLARSCCRRIHTGMIDHPMALILPNILILPVRPGSWKPEPSWPPCHRPDYQWAIKLYSPKFERILRLEFPEAAPTKLKSCITSTSCDVVVLSLLRYAEDRRTVLAVKGIKQWRCGRHSGTLIRVREILWSIDASRWT